MVLDRRTRSRWSVGLALIALLACTNGVAQDRVGQAGPSAEAAKHEQPAKPFAPPIPENDQITSAKQKTSDQRAEQRDIDDLVAQTAMAKAAKDQVGLVWWQNALTTGEMALLIATIFFTAWAALAASKATKAMRVANEIAGEGQRAWLSVKFSLTQPFSPGTTHLGVDGFYSEVGGVVQNHGRAPARHIRCVAEIRLLSASDPSMGQAMHAFCDDWRDRLTGNPDANIGPTLFAEEDRPDGHMIFLPQGDIDRVTAGQEQKWISPVVVGFISYETPHSEGIRQTRFAYSLSRLRDGRAAVIDAGEDGWWNNPIQVTNFEIIEAD